MPHLLQLSADVCLVHHLPQSSADVCPVPVVVVPIGQLVHSLHPKSSLYVPWGHGTQGKVRKLDPSDCGITVPVNPAIHPETDINKSYGQLKYDYKFYIATLVLNDKVDVVYQVKMLFFFRF